MKLLALLIGLIIERLATQLFHLRRLRFLDRAIDFGFRQSERLANWPALIPMVVLAIVLVAPVFFARLALGDTLFELPYMILAIIVLFFSLGPKDIGVDIGEKTRERFVGIVKGAKTVVWNGPMGVFEIPETAKGTLAIAQALAEATRGGAATIVGGGDSVAAIEKNGLADQVSHVSTGGGASLEFLEGKELPGVTNLSDK